MNKILTISIAAYNVSNYLENTLESLICEEKYLDLLEIIIENDGSTDDTQEIADKYAKKYPKSIKSINKSNGGYGSTINNSITVASAKYFKQLDGDDWYITTNLPGFIDFLLMCDSDIVITPFYRCIESKSPILVNQHRMLSENTQLLSNLKLEDNLLMHEMTVKTSLLKDNKVSITEHCFYTDNEFTIFSLMYAKTITKYKKAIYCYRLGLEEQSVSINGIRKHYRDYLIVGENICKRYKKYRKYLSDNMQQYILNVKIHSFIRSTYMGFMLLEDPLREKEKLISFDALLKNKYTDIYKSTNDMKLIAYPRKVNFHFYSFFCKLASLRFYKEQKDVL